MRSSGASRPPAVRARMPPRLAAKCPAQEPRRSARRAPGAPGALLAERLGSCAGHLAASLGGMRALTAGGLLAPDDLMQQTDVHLGLHTAVRELMLADDGALLVDFSYRWHIPN